MSTGKVVGGLSNSELTVNGYLVELKYFLLVKLGARDRHGVSYRVLCATWDHHRVILERGDL